jgi:putative ABC transport system ATP-binding protein
MLEITALEHAYAGRPAVLSLPHWRVEAGEHWLVLGPSGCGKSTLLHLAAGLLRPSSGRVQVAQTDLASLPRSARDRFRGRQIGIVFQRLHLIPSLTVLQNLLCAPYCAGLPPARDRASAALDTLGLGALAAQRPAQLSQGQQQRVAIARAVMNQPRLILADEPTASLDDASAEAVMQLLIEQARACGAALLVATHDARAKRLVERRLELGA